MRNNNKGFTLIELLVVIAIIGILATIVLTSLGSARQKANDAKAQAQLSSMRAQAELFYSSHNDYGTEATSGGCSASLFASGTADNLYNLLHNLPTGYTPHCYTAPTGGNATSWAVAAENPDSTAGWCVDSNGDSKTYTGAPGAPTSGAVCP